jgi:hypothetical protein
VTYAGVWKEWQGDSHIPFQAIGFSGRTINWIPLRRIGRFARGTAEPREWRSPYMRSFGKAFIQAFGFS